MTVFLVGGCVLSPQYERCFLPKAIPGSIERWPHQRPDLFHFQVRPAKWGCLSQLKRSQPDQWCWRKKILVPYTWIVHPTQTEDLRQMQWEYQRKPIAAQRLPDLVWEFRALQKAMLRQTISWQASSHLRWILRLWGPGLPLFETAANWWVLVYFRAHFPRVDAESLERWFHHPSWGVESKHCGEYQMLPLPWWYQVERRRITLNQLSLEREPLLESILPGSSLLVP